uniref:Uncharacterized protein n=2 Tax=Brugia TaxID=6278 RepID=A8P4N4_BRUMA
MTQDEVDVFECLNSLLKVVLQIFDRNSVDCDILDDEISTHIQGGFFFVTYGILVGTYG